MKILVLGAGYVGKPLAEYLKADISELRANTITRKLLEPYDVVINTIAKTAIDWCEKNRLEAFDTNVVQALRIAQITQITKGKYIFFSSGCIFTSEHGEINYEDAKPNPQCFYTYTKLIAEQILTQIRPDSLIIRPRLLISEKSNPRNTIDKLLKYTKIVTTQESATVLEDMLIKIKELIDIDAKGVFNIFNEGTISPSEIMDIFEHPHQKISKEELDKITKDRATRVSTILGTRRTTSLPDIRKRIIKIKHNWKL